MTNKLTSPGDVQNKRKKNKDSKTRPHKGPVTHTKKTNEPFNNKKPGVEKDTSKKASKEDSNNNCNKEKTSEKSDEPVWSKSKKKRMRGLKAKQAKLEPAPLVAAPSQSSDTPDHQQDNTEYKKNTVQMSTLQKSFQDRLSGSRFRALNEELYTQPSWEAFQKFQSNPELFEQYHAGYRKQTEQWPTNPVHVILQKIQNCPKSKQAPLVIADFGCGDAEIAKRLQNDKNFVVHSYDLVAKSELVTACDMSKVPLEQQTVDRAVFCLSLMGTNLADFVREAFRVLKPNGQLYVAEVRSRFESKESKNDLLDDFLKVMEHLGFSCLKTDRKNKMFFLMEFEKNGKVPDLKLEYTAKACIYKRR